MTLKSSPNLSLRHPPYAALLTVSKEFDPLFSRRTETLEPVAVMMGLGAEQRLRRRWTPPPPPPGPRSSGCGATFKASEACGRCPHVRPACFCFINFVSPPVA